MNCEIYHLGIIGPSNQLAVLGLGPETPLQVFDYSNGKCVLNMYLEQF